jgi:hypothetical protein
MSNSDLLDSSSIINVYTPTDEDIQMVLKQVLIDTTTARELLLKHNGDVLATILAAYNIDKKQAESVNYKSFDVESESQSIGEKLSAFRNILDEKDSVFQKNIAKEIDTTGAREFEYVMFNGETTKFTRNKITNTRLSFLEDIVRSYLEDDEPTNNKIINKYLGNDAKRLLASKWGFCQAGMLYINNDYYDQNDKQPVNQLATTLLRKSNNIGETEEFRGTCVIVNNWF